MLDEKAIAAASRTLHDHWRAGTKFSGLDDRLRPRDRIEAYAIQAGIEKYSSEQSVRLEDRRHQRGRTKAHQRRRPDGRTHPGRDRDPRWRNGFDGGQRNARRRTRIRLSHARRSAGADHALYNAAGARRGRHAASGHRDSDSRFSDFVSAGAAQIIADNACAHLFVLGPPTTADWRSLDLVEERPVVTLRGQQFIGHGKNVLGDPRVALTWLANELRQLGVTLKAGRIVTTGTCHPPLPIQSGDFCAVDFGALGKVSVGFK